MPIPIISHGVAEGISAIPHAFTVLKVAAVVTVVALLKYFFGGARNRSERLMHSKVVMVTGGTSGIGAAVVHDLASRGAQIILLTQHAPTDVFLVDYIEDLRQTTNNELIYAEQVDLTSLHSIRTFATKWVDNAPPRRLDMIILCANTLKPSRNNPPKITPDGLDEEWQINYLANFHLLSILSPAIRAQPPDRDVRVIFKGSTGKKSTKGKAGGGQNKKQSPSSLYGMTKLSLMVFAQAFQKHLSAYKRPDQQPMNARVLVVDPGFSRTPGTRRWITGGSLWGLFLYLTTWPFWWLILKSPQQGAQTILYAAMEAKFGRSEATGGWLLKECREIDYLRKEVKDEQVAKQLWEFSERQIQEKEKEAATKRALAKKANEEAKKTQNENKADTTTAAATASKNSSTSSAAPSSGKKQTAGSRRNRKANNE
ncbi:putative oxidoreductase C19A8,06 [Talaromyces islandicus]|uniref:Putative oxidoreductase C19A8,06 n=1 Tax=Talaromyces islandicus TaxID=28573 RepID=A0A0U1M4U8_TALIS|nr:putative oxidoreductase C19A8,06 [Talaromyces islandicus]